MDYPYPVTDEEIEIAIAKMHSVISCRGINCNDCPFNLKSGCGALLRMRKLEKNTKTLAKLVREKEASNERRV